MSAPATSAAVKAIESKRSVLQRVFDPVRKFGLCFENVANKKVARIPPPLKLQIEEAAVKGEDLSVKLTKKYFSDQKALLWYRGARLAEETRHLITGKYFRSYGLGKLLDDIRFLTQCFFLFLMCVIVGRRSVFPPVAPGSPFVEALKDKVNPNY